MQGGGIGINFIAQLQNFTILAVVVFKLILNLNKWTIENQGSFLNSDATTSTSKFIRNLTKTKYHFGKIWVGGSVQIEDNQEKDKVTNEFSALSQRFSEYGILVGRGDSTKVFVELGYLQRRNDSLQNGLLQHDNDSRMYVM